MKRITMTHGELLVEEDHSLEFVASPGTHIAGVAEQVCLVAKTRNADVPFDFNGVRCIVRPGVTPGDVVATWTAEMERRAEEYRNSPAGKKAKTDREAQVRARQHEISTVLVPSLRDIVGDLDLLVPWVARCSDVMDDCNVVVDYPGLVAILESRWQDGAHVGRKPHEFTKQMLGEWIVGQAINCMKRGMPPMGISQKFAKEYAERAH